MSDELSEVEKLTRKAIKASFRASIEDAVNWGDLHPCEVARVHPMPKYGRPYVRVVIEEASPEAGNFCKFIRTYLEKHGFPNVSVETEW